jgi:hypothetical protein
METEIAKKPKAKLPSLKSLYDGDLELKTEQNKLNILLNKEPNPKWIKDHPFAKGVKYIPIERIEYLLTRLFIKWKVEVKTIQTIANSVVVTIRLHYQNIEDMEWSWQDGVGAAPIQTEAKAGAMEWDKVRSDAVMKSAPAAESYAVKDAAEKIGKIFGKDLNRKDAVMYDSLVGTIPEEKISNSQIMIADELIRKSSLPEDKKQEAEAELTRMDLTIAEYYALVNTLKENQFKTY